MLPREHPRLSRCKSYGDLLSCEEDTDVNFAMCIKRTRYDFALGDSTLSNNRKVYAGAFARCTRTATAF
jgi:hypothetical protein